MNARNPKQNAVGTIDLEIDHPVYGWIPFTASPDDEGGSDLYEQALGGVFGPVAGYVEPVVLPPTKAQTNALRRAAYQAEADPLFFKWQRGESTEQAWIDTITSIRQRYPDS